MLISRPPKNSSLAPFIEAFWTCETSHGHELERVLPNGRVQLFFNLHSDALHHYEADGALRQRASGMALQGSTLAPVVIDRAEQRNLCGVLFAPGGAFPFFGNAISEIGSGLADLGDISWSNGWALQERLLKACGPHARLDVLETALLENAPIVQDWDNVIREVTGLLRQGWRVRALADRFNTTQQTLIARFRERTGMTPKTYFRVERFQKLLLLQSSASSWADAAVAAGFADQPHMVREFKTFSDITPTAYNPNGDVGPNHLPMPT